jgi:hypothetical protein
MAIYIRRREFFVTLGGVTAARPLMRPAQQPAMDIVVAPMHDMEVEMRRLLTSAIMLFAVLAPAHGAGDQIETKAGTWKTWVISSGREFRVAAPPNEAATAAEIGDLKSLANKRDAAAKDLIAYWNVGPPSYRWHEIALSEVMRNGLPWNYGMRDFALIHVAIYDAMLAAWDSKFAHNRKRPSEFDPSLSTEFPNPRSPSYPSEHAVAAGAAAAVLSYLFPDRASYFTEKAEEEGRSALLAGVQYPSDVKVGLELGRQVAARVIERGKADDSDVKWTGSIPTGPGKWNGTNPILPQMAMWKTWVLSSPSELRSPLQLRTIRPRKPQSLPN